MLGNHARKTRPLKGFKQGFTCDKEPFKEKALSL